MLDIDLSEDEHKFDLYWHALNYRTAATLPEATEMWHRLHRCVECIVARERDPLTAEWVDGN
jgi:hypothetical protein